MHILRVVCFQFAVGERRGGDGDESNNTASISIGDLRIVAFEDI